MRAFVFLGLALLCLDQVRCEKGDLLRSLLSEKARELKSEKQPEPEIFLAADPTPAYDCDANQMVINGTQLMKNTLDIISESFTVLYTAAFPETGPGKCSLNEDTVFGQFRCFLWEFNAVKVNIQDVSKKVKSYKSDAARLTKGISEYVENCVRRKS